MGLVGFLFSAGNKEKTQVAANTQFSTLEQIKWIGTKEKNKLEYGLKSIEGHRWMWDACVEVNLALP